MCPALTKPSSDLWPRLRKGANGAHNPASSASSTSKSSDQLSPNGPHITQLRSTPSNEEPHTTTSPSTSKKTSKPSRTMPLNEPPHAKTSHHTSNNTARGSRQRVTNDHTPDKPPRGEKARYGPPPAEVGPLPGTNPSRSEFQDVDPSSLAQTPAGQDDRPPPPPKDPATSGRPLPSSPPGMTTAYSRQAQEPAPGESQTPRGGHVPPEASVIPNESGGTAHPDMTGGHDPLNGQPAPSNISSAPVRPSTAKEYLSSLLITLITSHDQSRLLYPTGCRSLLDIRSYS